MTRGRWASTRPECLVADIKDDVEAYGGVALLYTALRVTLLLVLLQSVSALQWVLKQVMHLPTISPQSISQKLSLHFLALP